MLPNLAHIYGPLYLNCYGLAIALGFLLLRYLLIKAPQRPALLTVNQLDTLLIYSMPIAVLGGRLLWAVGELATAKSLSALAREFFALWEPGYSVLGAFLAILIFVPLYLHTQRIPVLKFLDLVAIYNPLFHAIARVGCFLAGCCHGLPTNLPWGVTYTHPDVLVPGCLKFIPLHPTQLYSAALLFVTFLFMYFCAQHKFKHPGQLLGIYLVLAGLERFMVDFWRADRELLLNCPLGLQQLIALGIVLGGLALLIYTKNSQRSRWRAG